MDRRLAGGLGLVLLQEAARETPAESSARQLLDRLAAAEIEDCWRSEYQADRGAVQRMVESGYTLATATLAGGHLMSLVTAMRQADPLGNALAGSMVPLHPPEESRTRALQAPITMPAFYEELLEEPGFRETSPGLAVHPSYDWSGDGKPWRVSRARQHAEITPDGSVARLASIVVSGERTVTEDGEIIRETIHFEAGQPVWTRTSDQARHLYRNGQIEETCEWIEHPDGTRTTTTTHYQQGQPSLTRRETTGIAAEDGGPPWTEVETPDGPSRSRSGADFEERVEADGTRVLSWLHFLPQRHPFEPVPATLPNGIAVQVSGLREPGELEGLSKLPFGPDARVCLVDAIQRRIGPDGVEQRGVILARDPVSNIHYVDRRHLAHADSVYLSALIGVR